MPSRAQRGELLRITIQRPSRAGVWKSRFRSKKGNFARTFSECSDRSPVYRNRKIWYEILGNELRKSFWLQIIIEIGLFKVWHLKNTMKSFSGDMVRDWWCSLKFWRFSLQMHLSRWLFGVRRTSAACFRVFHTLSLDSRAQNASRRLQDKVISKVCFFSY